MLMLLVVCASLAALALGVIAAYAICRGILLVFRHRAQFHANSAVVVSAGAAHSSL